MVTPVMVRQCMSDLGNDEKVKQRFRRAERFWDYCIGNQLADGKNPITDLLKGGKHKAVNAAAAERSIGLGNAQLPGNLLRPHKQLLFHGQHLLIFISQIC